ncbi:MAG: hypothetical protein WD334_08205 [Chitinophagales bacterium]
MPGKKVNRLLLIASIISLIYIAAINYFFGTYFDTYESFINSIVLQECAAPITNNFFVPQWFGVFPLISDLSSAFPQAHIYALLYTIINTLILGVLIFVFMIIYNKNKNLVFTSLAGLFSVVTFTCCIVYVNNHRAAYFSIFAALLLLYLIRYHNIPRYYLGLSILLLGIGIVSRLEIAVITLLIASVFVFLFNRKLFKTTTILLLTSISLYSYYLIYQSSNHPDHKLILKAEHEFFDRMSIKAEKNDSSYYKLQAMNWFIRDDEVYDIDDYQILMEERSLIEYFKSSDFRAIYVGKFDDLLYDLEKYQWLVFLTLYITSHIVIVNLFGKNKQRSIAYKTLLFAGFLLTLPVLFNVYLVFPYSVAISICVSMCVLYFIYISEKNDSSVHGKINLSFIFAFLILSSIFYFKEVAGFEADNFKKAFSVRKIKENFANSPENKTIVFAHGFDFTNYPSKLFSDLHAPKIKHYNLDFYLFHVFDFYKKHNRPFFGEDLPYLSERISKCANDSSIVLISQDGYNQFLKEYLKNIHDMDIEFRHINTGIKEYALKPFYVKCSNC